MLPTKKKQPFTRHRMAKFLSKQLASALLLTLWRERYLFVTARLSWARRYVAWPFFFIRALHRILVLSLTDFIESIEFYFVDSARGTIVKAT
jgi:hypothetical protein